MAQWNPFKLNDKDLSELRGITYDKSKPVTTNNFDTTGVLPYAGQGAGETPSFLSSVFSPIANLGADIVNNTPINDTRFAKSLGNTLDSATDSIANLFINNKPLVNTTTTPSNPYLANRKAEQDYINSISRNTVNPNINNVNGNPISPATSLITSLGSNRQNFTSPDIANQTRNQLASLGNFTPERNTFASDARGRYDQLFNNLLGSYNEQVMNPDNSFGALFNQLKTRGGLSKQLGLVSNQLNTNNQLAASDIASSNQLGLQDLTSQRNNMINLGQLEQQQVQNQNMNQYNYDTLNNRIKTNNVDEQLRVADFNNRQPLVNLQNRAITDINKGSNPANYSTQELQNVLSTPEYQATIQRANASGIPISQYLPDLLNDYAQKSIRNNSIALSSLTNNLSTNKPSVTAELVTPEGLTLKGTPDEIMATQERLKNMKDSKGKALINSSGVKQ